MASDDDYRSGCQNSVPFRIGVGVAIGIGIETIKAEPSPSPSSTKIFDVNGADDI